MKSSTGAYPLKRPATVDEVTPARLFLASDLYLGRDLAITGGMTHRRER